MNIFAVSDDVTLCAQALDDKRLVKMLTETCQLLSSARLLLQKPAPYKLNHAKHPATLWAVQRFQHRCWLGALGQAYYTEYRLRFAGGNHGAWEKCGTLLMKYSQRLDHVMDIHFVNCARHSELGVDFTNESNVHVAYRKYLIARWTLSIQEKNPKTIPTFTNRRPPDFAGQLKPYFKIK